MTDMVGRGGLVVSLVPSPECKRFKLHSSCHVGTLGKSFNHNSCLYNPCNNLLSSIHTMSVIHTCICDSLKC